MFKSLPTGQEGSTGENKDFSVCRKEGSCTINEVK